MENQEQNITDEELVWLVQEGDSEKFGELVGRYEEKITRYGRKFLQDNMRIEDAVQEVFLKAYRNIKSFDTGKKFSSWIYRIAHNEFINSLRKDKRDLFSFFDPELLAIYPARDDTHGDFEKQETVEMLSSTLSSLDKKYREVLLLYYEEGFSYQEISDILRIPLATVGVRLRRGKARLKELYNKRNNNGPRT